MTIKVDTVPITVAVSNPELPNGTVIYNKDDPVEQKKCEEIVSKLTPEEVAAMPDELMPRRYLRGEKGKVDSAVKKLKNTLKWRKEFEVDKIVQGGFDDLMRNENATGKMYTRCYDKEGSAVMHMKPGLENTYSETDQMRHLVYILERAIAATNKRSNGTQEKICILISFEGFSAWNSPPMSTTRHTLTILQDHYPERMKRAFICHPPAYFKVFWGLASPFIDPVTKEKVVFCSNETGLGRVKELMDDMTKVEECAGGTAKREFVSSEFISLPFHKTFDE